MLCDLEKIIAIIKGAAQEVLLPGFSNVQRQIKADGSFVTEADLAVQTRISNELQACYPNIPLLGEEMSVSEQEYLLHSSQSLWCLDPVDGTSNFAAGIPYYVISLGLIENGKPTLGIVYDLNRDECFVGIKGEGAYLNNKLLKISSVDLDLSQCSALVDFKRLPKNLAAKLATDPPYLSQRNFGSVALEWCWLAASRGHVYLHGSQNIWDFVAGNLILSEAGGTSSSFEGEAVYTNELKPRSAVAALDNRLFKEWFNWIECASKGNDDADKEKAYI